MSTYYWGAAGNLQIDATEGGALTDISADVKNVKLSFERKSAELPRLGNNSVAQLVGQYVATLEIELHGTTAVDDIFGAAAVDSTPTTRSVQLGPFGTTAGLPKYTFEGYVAKYEPENDGDDPLGMTAEMVVDSAGVTRGTF